MLIRRERNEGRSFEELTEQFKVERRLASQLKTAGRDERKSLYGSLYEELFSSLPHHPQQSCTAAGKKLRQGLVRGLGNLVARFVGPDTTFLEVGAGDCELSLQVANLARQVYALDVCAQIRSEVVPANFELILSDGCSVPVAAGSVDVAFSHQLLEHLHPDDAQEQLRNVRAALAPGGTYICITPSRFSGPHDISKFFADEPSGFHLKEYSTRELVALFERADFSRFAVFFWSKGVLLRVPVDLVTALEALLSRLPRPAQRWVSGAFPLNRLLGNFIAWK